MKMKDMVHISVPLEPKLREELIKEGLAEERNLAHQIRWIIKDWRKNKAEKK